MLGDFGRDVKYGIRTLAGRPGFTCVAVLTLALGIGANAAIFSIVNAALLRPLPYHDPGRLVLVLEANPSRGIERMGSAPPDFRVWRESNRVFTEMAAFYGGSFNISSGDEPEQVPGKSVSADFFSLLGSPAFLGRTFLEEEEQFGKHRVAVLSHGLWRRRFASDPGAVGRDITLNGERYNVIGIMPEGFRDPKPGIELWVPMSFEPGSNLNTRNNYFLLTLARLRPGVTIQQARDEMAVISRDLERRFQENAGVESLIVPLRQAILGNFEPALFVLTGAVALVLLIACANVANLLLARASARRKEIAIRAALGASRVRMLRQLLTESLLLGLLGGCAGLLLAVWTTEPLASLGPPDLSQFHTIGVDGRVVIFLLGISLLACALFGVAPAFHASKAGLSDALKEGARGAVGGSSAARARGALVVAEVALSLILMIGAGLLIRSFLRLVTLDPGFQPDHVLTLQIPLPRSKYPEAHQAATFFSQLLQRIEALPGVVSAGVASSLPLSNAGTWGKSLTIEGRPASRLEEVASVQYRLLGGDFFRSLGIPMHGGRPFTGSDTKGSVPVAVVNETAARRFFPGEDPIGKRISLDAPENLIPIESRPANFEIVWLTIVGVAADVRQGGLDQSPAPEVYAPVLQNREEPVPMFLIVRATEDPLPLVAAVRSQVWTIDDDQPVASLATMQQILDRSVSQPRFNALLLVLFAAAALLLAIVGLYGLISYSVSQRTHEIGIRMALGARHAQVLRMIVGQGLRLTLWGVALGLAGAAAFSRAISGLLFEVVPIDPITFILMPVLFTGVALLASYIPARRAAKIDPMIALRCE